MGLSKVEINRLLSENEKLVKYFVTVVYHISDKDDRYEDCLQEGRFAMYNTLCKIDSLDNLKCKLSTILGNSIRYALYDYVGTNHLITMSTTTYNRIHKLKKKAEKGEELTEREQRSLNGLSMLNTVSLDAPVGEEDNTCLLDMIAYENPSKNAEELWNAIMDYIASNQNPTHRAILTEYFVGVRDGEKPSLTALGNAYNITKEAVRQVISRNTKKMQELLV